MLRVEKVIVMGVLRLSKLEQDPISTSIMLEDNWLGECVSDCDCLSAQELQKPELMEQKRHSPVLRLLTSQNKLPTSVLLMAQKLHLCAVRRAALYVALRIKYRIKYRDRLNPAS